MSAPRQWVPVTPPVRKPRPVEAPSTHPLTPACVDPTCSGARWGMTHIHLGGAL
jgi:hypothetical protein